MNIFKRFKNWFKTKTFDLRKACVEKYGEEFGEMYDSLNRGEAIGGFMETIAFLEMLETVKKENGIE